MAMAETAELAVVLKLSDQMSGGLARAGAALGGLERASASGSGGMARLRSAAMGVGGAMGHAAGQIKGLVTGPLGLIGMAGGVYGLVGALKGSISSATSFQSAMELIATQAGGTQAEVESMSRAVLAMAGPLATSPELLAAGLYHVESAGIRGARALDVLRTAAEGAKVGNADLESVTNALIASVNSGIRGTSDMGAAMGSLNAVVGAGNMRMGDLTAAFSTGILSTAAAAGISFNSLGAAIADMTNQGVPAIDAATRLRMSISLLAAPTSKAEKLFKSIGVSGTDLANQMRGPGGISAAITDLQAHMVKAGFIDASGKVNTAGFQFLSHAFGGGRSSSAIITLVNSMGRLREIQAQVTKGSGAFGDAWAKTQRDSAFAFEKFQSAVGAASIRIGDVLLPLATTLASGLGDWVTQHGDEITSFFASAAGFAKGLGSAVAQYVLPAFGGIVSAWNAIPGPLKDILIGGFVAQKASSFLFGSGPLDWLKSAAGIVRGGARGGIGGALSGALGVQHVWVDNMGLGGGGGGGLPGAAGGGAASWAGFLTPGLGAAVAAVATPFIMFNVIPALVNAAYGNDRKAGESNTVTVRGSQGQSEGTLTGPYGAMQNAWLGNQLAKAGASSYGVPSQDSSDRLRGSPVSTAHSAAYDTGLAAAVAGAVRGLERGLETGGERSGRLFMAALDRVSKRASTDSQRFVVAQLKTAEAIVKGSGSADRKADQLRSVEASLLRRGDAWAAAQVRAIERGKPVITTNVAVSVTAGGIQKTVSVSSRYGASVGSYGGAKSPGGVRS